jgi:hypothetical protein
VSPWHVTGRHPPPPPFKFALIIPIGHRGSSSPQHHTFVCGDQGTSTQLFALLLLTWLNVWPQPQSSTFLAVAVRTLVPDRHCSTGTSNQSGTARKHLGMRGNGQSRYVYQNSIAGASTLSRCKYKLQLRLHMH